MGWQSRPEAQLAGKGDKFQGGFIVVSNREPYAHRKTSRGLKMEVSAGGLVSALDTVLRVTGGTWIAWGSGSGDREGAAASGRIWVPPTNPAYIMRRIWLSAAAVENYYHGFCNLVLWPLFHGETDRIVFNSRFWDEYEKANQVFAEAVLEERGENTTIWIHDYHLCLVPRMLRALDPERIIAHFWHVPWPVPEVFAQAPHGEEIIAGLLGNDLIGFQIPLFARNFMKCAASCLDAAVDYDAMTVNWKGRITRIGSFPISTDFVRFSTLGASVAKTAEAGRIREKYRLPRLVGLAVDRLDYSKGILQRLQALGLFFRRNRDFRGLFTFVQVAVMTRSEEPYLRYRQEVRELIDGINAEFGTAAWQPILYRETKLEQHDLVAYYRLSDVAVITPISDGMNLVAKEYVASRADGEGVLILSRTAGAAVELDQSLRVDPCDIEACAHAIYRALTMPRGEKRHRMAALRKQVQKNTVYHWVGDILDELALLPVTKMGGKHALSHGDEILNRLAGRELFLCLDFDGTLVPIAEQPELVAMPDNTRALLCVLKERYPVAVISGRSLDDLEGRAGLSGIAYMGNHGAEMRGAEPGSGGRTSLEEFLAAAHQVFASLPGIQVEDKGLTASIHFRRVKPVCLGDFLTLFSEIVRKFAEKISVSEGRKVFEIRAQGAVDKGDAVHQLMAGIGKGRLPIYIGDDTSDEAAFRAVRGAGVSVAVGGSPEADYYLRNQGEVHEFLELLARIPCLDREKCCARRNAKGAQQ